MVLDNERVNDSPVLSKSLLVTLQRISALTLIGEDDGLSYRFAGNQNDDFEWMDEI